MGTAPANRGLWPRFYTRPETRSNLLPRSGTHPSFPCPDTGRRCACWVQSIPRAWGSCPVWSAEGGLQPSRALAVERGAPTGSGLCRFTPRPNPCTGRNLAHPEHRANLGHRLGVREGYTISPTLSMACPPNPITSSLRTVGPPQLAEIQDLPWLMLPTPLSPNTINVTIPLHCWCFR